MRKMLNSLIVIMAVSLIFARAATEPSPKEVVEEFVKMDVDGDRLKPEGWRAADILFTKRSEPVYPPKIVVIARHYAVSPVPGPNKKNEFYFGYEGVGQFDASSLRFSPSNKGKEMRSFERYIVVLTETGREGGSENKGSEQRPNRWKIEGSQPATIHLTARAAIVYITEIREQARDSKTKKNAEQALAQLSLYR